MKVLVTGATGFIGSHLINNLEEDSVFCVVRDKGRIRQSEGRVSIQQDLALPLNIANLPEDLDAIVHLATASVPFPNKAAEFFRVNTVSTQELLDYGRSIGIKTFVYVSSGSVYGDGKRAFKESDIPHPSSYYAVTKYCSELLVGQYHQYFNTVILRLFIPYGRGQQKGRLVPSLIEKVQKGEEVTIYNDGNPRTNPIYVSEAIRAILKSFILSGHHIINVGGWEVYSIRELADLIGELTGIKPRYKFLSDEAKQDVVGDIALMKSILDFEPRISLREGLKLIMGKDWSM